MAILSGILTGLLFLLSIALIAVVMMQTPKSEGFTGGVSNAQGGSFRGKAGFDEMLSQYTRYIAIGWFASAFVLAVLGEISRRG
ncbi:MAG: preprotein translocase subunit SecG [Capsulimonadales bacterium]|nr:preprotein translocase subunit SecG [Capsulimonadales bacterium]